MLDRYLGVRLSGLAASQKNSSAASSAKAYYLLTWRNHMGYKKGRGSTIRLPEELKDYRLASSYQYNMLPSHPFQRRHHTELVVLQEENKPLLQYIYWDSVDSNYSHKKFSRVEYAGRANFENYFILELDLARKQVACPRRMMAFETLKFFKNPRNPQWKLRQKKRAFNLLSKYHYKEYVVIF